MRAPLMFSMDESNRFWHTQPRSSIPPFRCQKGCSAKRVLATLVLGVCISGCGGSNGNGGSTPTAPTNFTITVTSPNTNVLFGATEQMTATASDGRVLTGTWSTDNTSVATVSTTGLVTPAGAGQATVIFSASTGQSGTKLLRGLPSLSGTFTGNYSVTSCTQSGGVALANLCGSATVGTLAPYTFNWTQSVDVLSGRFFLGTIEFDNITGTISLGGSFTFKARAAGTGTTLIDATWNLTASQPNRLGGTLATIWTSTGLSGQANINGSISTVSKTASVPLRALPRTLDDAIRAFTGR